MDSARETVEKRNSLDALILQLEKTLKDNKEKLEAQEVIKFWVLPWKPLLQFGLLGVFVVALLIFGIIRYNKWVIKHAQRP